MKDLIITRRNPDQDASAVASYAAQEAGTHLIGNMRWYAGPCNAGLPYREISTADGRGVRVLEPAVGDVSSVTVPKLPRHDFDTGKIKYV